MIPRSRVPSGSGRHGSGVIRTGHGHRTLLGLALLLPLLFGCDLDFTAPYPGEATLLSLTLSVDASDSAKHAHLAGQLHPGRDRSGIQRTVEAGELEILGRTLDPIEVASDGRHRYHHEWEFAVADNPGHDVLSGPVTLIPPRVRDTPSTPSRLDFGTCHAAGPVMAEATSSDSSGIVLLTRSPTRGDLTLQVSCDHDPRLPSHSGWSLEIRTADTGGTILHLESNAPAPETLTIPPSWLQEEEGDLEIILILSDHFSWTSSPPGYRTALTVNWRFAWPLP